MRSVVVSGSFVLLAAAGLFVACGADDPPPPPQCACQHEHAHGEEAPSSGLPAAAPLPDTSIYQLDGVFSDQDAHPFALSSLRGSPVLVLMFYGSCQSVCPLLISQALRVDQGLTEDQRAHLRVVLVTFDPERDTPERLRALAAERQLPLERWSLLRGDDDAIRELAMVLGVQYRRTADGAFVHSATVALLDREGRVAMQLEGTDTPVGGLAERTRALISEAPERSALAPAP